MNTAKIPPIILRSYLPIVITPQTLLKEPGKDFDIQYQAWYISSAPYFDNVYSRLRTENLAAIATESFG